MRAVILSIGDELVLGQTVDTNAAWLSAALAEIGVDVRYHLTVADDREVIAAAIAEAAGDASVVLVTGGLGPTDDDLTRDALGDLLEEPLLLDPDALELIRQHFARRKRPMSQRNEVQAMRPASTAIIPNPVGTAPGLQAEYEGASVFILPGVPSEMKAIYREHVQPQLRTLLEASGDAGRAIHTATIHTFGLGESDVANRLGRELTARDRNPLVGTTVSNGIISIRVRSTSESAEVAAEQLEQTVATVEQKLGSLVFGRDGVTLEQAVVNMLREGGRTVATAESCTGGLVAKMLTDPAGASECFLGGYVVYANAAKQRDLNVPAEMLETHGAVSEPVAACLAENAREQTEADFALSLTGVAGPGGGTEEKPVGMVWIALAERDRPTVAAAHYFAGDRSAVRERAAKVALNLLRRRLVENEP